MRKFCCLHKKVVTEKEIVMNEKIEGIERWEVSRQSLVHSEILSCQN